MTPARFCENCGTALDPSQRFCGGCGQPADGTAPASGQQPMMSTPLAASAAAASNWHMPTWAWLVVGLLTAGGIGGGLYYVFDSAKPKQPVYTQAQQDSIAKQVFDDLPDNPDGIDLAKATNPTDLPPDLQKKFDNSRLSEQHKAEMAAALAPLPKIDGELVSTKGKPTISDDFSDPASGWRVGEDDKAIREYANGALQITYTAERGSAMGMLGKKAANFAMQIDATPVSGPPKFWYGLAVRQSAAQKFIVFLINPQGQYAVSKRENGQNTAVEEPFVSAAIKKGNAKNVLKLTAVDDYFVFEVNGLTVSVQEIKGYEPGDVGVIVLRSKNDVPDPTKVSFDNFKLWAAR
ncbi:MAG: zinc ribbon domain-containing protein [Gemmatimonadota bacterium]|nr:zinc ribbon domain-containing protein [Gemmatimonadota bacterium]